MFVNIRLSWNKGVYGRKEKVGRNRERENRKRKGSERRERRESEMGANGGSRWGEQESKRAKEGSEEVAEDVKAPELVDR